MSRIEETIEIAAARADVFRFCHDLKNRPGWDEQIEHVELLTPQPFRQGTLLRVDGKAGGAVFSWDAEVISYQMPSVSKVRVIDAASSSAFAPGSELSWEFSQAGNGTRLKWVWDYKPYGFIASILDKLGRRASTQKAIRRSLESLKVALESGQRGGIN